MIIRFINSGVRKLLVAICYSQQLNGTGNKLFFYHCFVVMGVFLCRNYQKAFITPSILPGETPPHPSHRYRPSRPGRRSFGCSRRAAFVAEASWGRGQ